MHPPFDEMYAPDGGVRPHYAPFARWLAGMPAAQVEARRAEADALFRRAGITFAVYGDEGGTERLIPFDILPRIIPAGERQKLLKDIRLAPAWMHPIFQDLAGEDA